MSFRFLFFHAVLFAIATITTVTAAEPESFTLAKDDAALCDIVIGKDADEVTRTAATDLAQILEKASGVAFKVTEGTGSEGVAVGIPEDFPALPFKPGFEDDPFKREEYLIRTQEKGIYLLGNTPLAVQHAVWDLLQGLGYRQFFPGKTWEVLPELDEITLALDMREAPDFYARRIWYNWGMGWGYNREPYKDWSRKNRMARGFMLHSGHAYDHIARARKEDFAKHPEYYALVDGKRNAKPGAKFCISNPDLRKVVVDYAVERIKKNPALDSISMDPSDGGGWCECEECAEMGSVSDRALTLANEVAEAINNLGMGEKYVGMYAYNEHCPPPTIKVHPNVIMSCTTAFLTGGYTFDQVVTGWQEQGATIGVYDYFSVVAWDWNRPRAARASRIYRQAEAIRKRYDMGARFYDAESGDAWGPYGLGYYISNLIMWDVENAGRVDVIMADFLERAFGPAREPMEGFYRLITVDDSKRSSGDMLARMYRFLAEARKLAGDDVAVRRRIDDLIKYTRYYELYEKFASATGDAKEEAKKAAVTFAYRIRETSMVHSYGLWARMVGQKEAHRKDSPLKDETPITEAEILGWLKDGIANYQPVDIDFETASYSDDLVPVRGKLPIPDVPEGVRPSVPQSRQIFHIWVEKPGNIELEVKTKKVWKKQMPKIILRSPHDVTATQIAEDSSWGPDNLWHKVTLKTPYRGLHMIELIDGGDYSHIRWPEGMPVVQESSPTAPTVNNSFRGPWTMYFYVPKGTEVVGGWAQRIAAWAPRISGLLKDSSGKVHIDFSERNNGWFRVDVPDGQDGKFWSFEKSQGMRNLYTVPPYLAVHPSLMLLPREVLDRSKSK